MARTFSKNTSNTMSLGVNAIGPLINGLAAVSIHAWVFPTSYDNGAFDNRILSVQMSGGSGALILAVDNSGANPVLAVGGRSILADGFQSKVATSSLGTGAYKSVGAVFNYGASTITPYVDGTAEGGGSVSFGSATYVHTTAVTDDDVIGVTSTQPANLVTTAQFDGRIAELAIWDSALSGANFLSLAGGADPTTIAGGPIAYLRILGDDSPETDEVNGLVGTITGSLPQSTHPTISGGTVATPTIDANGGAFSNSTTVTLACATGGADIYYTTDGSTPDAGDTLYTVPFALNATTTLKVIAIKAAMTDSAVATAVFTFTAATPAILPAAGAILTTDDITITCATSGAAIYYTIDGSTPDSGDTLYSGAFQLAADATVKAIAIKSGYTDSAVASSAFTVSAPAGGTAPRSNNVVKVFVTTDDKNGLVPIRMVTYGTENAVPVETVLAMADGVVPVTISTDANAIPCTEVEP